MDNVVVVLKLLYLRSRMCKLILQALSGLLISCKYSPHGDSIMSYGPDFLPDCSPDYYATN